MNGFKIMKEDNSGVSSGIRKIYQSLLAGDMIFLAVKK